MKKRVITIGVQLRNMPRKDILFSMDELCRLVDTAGGEVIASFVQKREKFSPHSLIGEGKINEIHSFCDRENIDTVVFDDPLLQLNKKILKKS